MCGNLNNHTEETAPVVGVSLIRTVHLKTITKNTIFY